MKLITLLLYIYGWVRGPFPLNMCLWVGGRAISTMHVGGKKYCYYTCMCGKFLLKRMVEWVGEPLALYVYVWWGGLLPLKVWMSVSEVSLWLYSLGQG